MAVQQILEIPLSDHIKVLGMLPLAVLGLVLGARFARKRQRRVRQAGIRLAQRMTGSNTAAPRQ